MDLSYFRHIDKINFLFNLNLKEIKLCLLFILAGGGIMSNSLINSTIQIDATLTKEGYAADAKAVGNALAFKKTTQALTVDQYNIAFFVYPKDFKMALQYICPDALLVPQVDYGSGINFRCFGNTNANSLSTMIGKTINITCYYL